ncbi:MAG TPA: acetate kinase [Turneriella sp.]|nr:acetate kinase [Turneriella sp.]HNE18502.1 acetate kinase [Turneriella sp.]HNL55484.1 acetate kinase [Turneriella sp.]
MKKILVINSGSSTIKADVFAVKEGVPVFLAKALADKLGKSDALLSIKDEQKKLREMAIAGLDVPAALERLFAELADAGICRADELVAIGHRVVHGGSRYTAPVVVDDAVIAAIRGMAVFAPLHNPANLAGIEHCRRSTTVPQVAVFDTAFHQTMPAVASTYAIPRELSEKYGIRRYGFHGTSHEYVTRECARVMGVGYAEFNSISLHLGNGASACAVRSGKSIDTSMGFTPLEGLVMGTRSGDLDPSLPFFLQNVVGLTAADAENLLNKKSGLLGLSGVSDMRELLSRADAGDGHAALARDIFCARIRKYIGAYLVWGRPHAIIFTGGIGENSPEIRRRVLESLEHLDIHISIERNQELPADGKISRDEGVAVYVVSTDEELMIAQQALWLITP